MASSSTSTPLRQSCDRCHSQKLRCIRSGDRCSRCLRQGAQCVYSLSLPKGRPSMYASKSVSNPPPMPDLNLHDATATTTCGTNANTNTESDSKPIADANANENQAVNEYETFAGPMDLPMFMGWPEPMNWNEMQIDGLEGIGTGTFLDAFPKLLDRNSTLDWNSTEHGFSEGLIGDYFGSSIGITGSPVGISEKSALDSGIAKLSQLSIRLYPLHRSSSSLVAIARSSSQSRDCETAPKCPLIDDTALKSIASWVADVPVNMNIFKIDRQPETAGDTLHDAFAASHHLLEILYCLQVDVETEAPASNGVADLDISLSISASSTAGSSESSWGLEKDKEIYTGPCSRYSEIVVCHLVIACHTLLLNVYVGVLGTLQHDADLRSSRIPGGNSKVDPDACSGSTSPTNIQLVLVVQLCSYLVERQLKAVGAYLSTQSSQLPGSNQPSTSPTFPHTVVSELQTEVQQLLTRLRQTLLI